MSVHVIARGRLVRDAEYTADTNSSSNRLKFRLAADTWKDETVFFNCTMFGTLADRAVKQRANGSYSQGCLTEVSGILRVRKYTDKNGVERESLEITVDRAESMPRKDSQKEDAPAAQQYASAPQYAAPAQEPQAYAAAPAQQQYAPAPAQEPAPQYAPAPQQYAAPAQEPQAYAQAPQYAAAPQYAQAPQYAAAQPSQEGGFMQAANVAPAAGFIPEE